MPSRFRNNRDPMRPCFVPPSGVNYVAPGFSNTPSRSLCPLPMRAFHLDPPTAGPARVARLPPFGHDALEPEAIAVVEQDLAVFEHLEVVEEGHRRAVVEPIQPRLRWLSVSPPLVHRRPPRFL